MKTKVVIIGVVVIVAISLLLVFRKTSPPDPSRGEPTNVPPVIPTSQIVNMSTEVRYTFQTKNETFPQELPHYKTSQQNNLLNVRGVALKLGFTEEAKESSRTGAIQWIDQQQSLSYYPQKNRFSYSSNKAIQKSPSTKTEAINTAAAFFSLGSINMGKITIDQSDVSFVKTAGMEYSPATSPFDASAATLSFSYAIDGVPIYNAAGAPLASNFQVHANRAIGSASIVFPPNIITFTNKKTIPTETAKAELAKNNGKLLWISLEQPNEYSAPTILFSDVSISSTALAYMYLQDSGELIPIFVFSGTVLKGNEQSTNARVVFAVPAVYK